MKSCGLGLRVGAALTIAVSTVIAGGLFDLSAPAPARAANLSTPEGCKAAGGTFDPASAQNPLAGCAFPVGGPPTPTAVITATTTCGKLWQMYLADLDAANHDAGWAAQQKLDLQAATVAHNGYVAERCDSGGGGGGGNGPTPGSPGFGQSYVPVTGAPRTTERYNQLTNNGLATMNAGIGFLAAEQAQQQADQQAAQAQADAEDEQEQQAEALRLQQEQQADAQRRANQNDPFVVAANGGAGAGQAGAPGSNPFGPNASSGGGPTPANDGSAPGAAGANPFAPASPDGSAQAGQGAGVANPTGAGGQPQQLAQNDPASDGSNSSGPMILGDPELADSRPSLSFDDCHARNGEVNGPPGARYCIIGTDWYHLQNQD